MLQYSKSDASISWSSPESLCVVVHDSVSLLLRKIKQPQGITYANSNFLLYYTPEMYRMDKRACNFWNATIAAKFYEKKL